ncbi:hypothetical protein WICPIJ_008927 [Wickerhamomyces pijperi]|uniref:Uncharacterized protein n=1 Tax=Wickerhamomyces pijperi TaxID=599730 RepID=A0A9P8TGQ5_WICPI|nr:hypothetical protein WICPIJ_008927 [Wickerhamomyces pijperi]
MSDNDFKNIIKDLDTELSPPEVITTTAEIQYDIPNGFNDMTNRDSMDLDLEEGVMTTFQPPTAAKKSNKQLIRSLLYMGLLLKGNNTRVRNDNDYLITSLEMVTVFMDNLNIFTRFGIGKNSKVLKSLSQHTNKVWFVTLMLNINRNLQEIYKLNKLQNLLKKEILKCEENSNYELAKIIIAKYENKIGNIKKIINVEFIDMFINVIDFFFISIELFRFKVPQWLKKFVENLSTFLSFYRLFRR